MIERKLPPRISHAFRSFWRFHLTAPPGRHLWKSEPCGVQKTATLHIYNSLIYSCRLTQYRLTMVPPCDISAGSRGRGAEGRGAVKGGVGAGGRRGGGEGGGVGNNINRQIQSI